MDVALKSGNLHKALAALEKASGKSGDVAYIDYICIKGCGRFGVCLKRLWDGLGIAILFFMCLPKKTV